MITDLAVLMSFNHQNYHSTSLLCVLRQSIMSVRKGCTASLCLSVTDTVNRYIPLFQKILAPVFSILKTFSYFSLRTSEPYNGALSLFALNFNLKNYESLQGLMQQMIRQLAQIETYSKTLSLE